jgi:CelD/BcsL family acetyltransferase involved in cellulose biosynthesis
LDSMLRSIASGPWSRITFRALPQADPLTERLRASLRTGSWLISESPHEVCPVVDTREPYEAYSERFSRNARKQIRRAHRRLEREGRVEVKVLESVGELEPVLSECLQLEAAGRKGRSGKAILTSEQKTRFWRDAFARFHGLGTLRYSSLRLDGSLIAMSLDVLHERRLYMLKTGYDERLARFSPGHVLYAEMIRASCEGTIIDAHELLGPMQPFKARYATESRQTVTLRAYRRRPVPIARYAARRWAVPLLRPIYVEARGLRDRRLERRTADRTPPPRSIGN